MKTQRLLVALTVINLGAMLFTLAQTRKASAADVAPVLRGRALEIVDDHGRVRASITLFPADPKVKMPDGTVGYPETVLLRLITSQGRPNVKIEANENGAGVGLGGESDPTYASISARHSHAVVKLTNKDGHDQLIKP